MAEKSISASVWQPETVKCVKLEKDLAAFTNDPLGMTHPTSVNLFTCEP
ncbi:uncharacterized protein PITG_11411 [Phytophthora infestans T30-4]|uniref:Uncharacterized protein n=1 Tax=Phytophthora infestans (strain T30-4) TaxID=403677 RepID=D0NIQ4_PHYIT|nr:uncharacterized protein PITG_11411 [Phytophthora infestans T30-4]EEY59388.1 hypothetical protein PITG_11411 [Phytophthora infestans T30-4]|eukprot:XP_002900998.1 hypothetical protein PITG_11411 [Phytophthora infestans T30-4]